MKKTPTSETLASKPNPRKAGMPAQKRLDDARANIQRLEAENALLARQIKAMLEEMNVLLLDTREERSAFKKSLQGATQREEALRETLRVRDEEIRRLRESGPWGITAPLRQVKRLLDGRRNI